MLGSSNVSEASTQTKGRAAGGTSLSQREFLKTLAGALGLAGAGLMAIESKKAEATYYTGSPDRVDTDLRVEGTLTIRPSGTSPIITGEYSGAGSNSFINLYGYGTGDMTLQDNFSGGKMYLRTTGAGGHIVLEPGGKVGIGRTPADYTLEVNGSIAAINGSGDVSLVLSGGSASAQCPIYVGRGGGAKYGLAMSAAATPKLQFTSYLGGGDMLVLDGANGRIGIGTTAPAATLDVAGDLNTTLPIKVNGTEAIGVNGIAKRAYYDT